MLCDVRGKNHLIYLKVLYLLCVLYFLLFVSLLGKMVNRAMCLMTKCGGTLHLSENDAKKIKLFKNILKFTNDEHCTIKVNFSRQVIQTYLFWKQINNITDIMDWSDVLNLIIFADYADCYDFITYFVRCILPSILNERNTCYARYLLSIRQNPDYIKIVEEHDDEWDCSYECKELQQIDEKDEESGDNILTYIPFKELIWVFPRLSFPSRERLARLFPPSHPYGKRLREMLAKYVLVMHKDGRNESHTSIIRNRGIMTPYR